jgi:hypothetical protein
VPTLATEKHIIRALSALTTDRVRIPDARRLRDLIRLRRVVGVGIAEKIRGNQPTGRLALTFYVPKKLPLAEIPGSELIPPVAPQSISGGHVIPTDVVALGRLRPHANVARQPIQPGFSIGHIQAPAGTLGAIVTDAAGRPQVLSNSHVLANSGRAKIGDKVLYPGQFDGGTAPRDVVGRLVRFRKFRAGGKFVNDVDCAVASIDPHRQSEVTPKIKGLGAPQGITKPRRGMRVVKAGRASGITTGIIRDVHLSFWMHYEGIGEVGFRNQVLCTRYAAPGDSGALVLEEGTMKAVGLHFAGAERGSVFNPIEKVLDALRVELAGSPRKKAGVTKK